MNPDDDVVIKSLDEAAIKKWWDNYQKTHKNWNLSDSCAAIAEAALNAGGPQWYDQVHDAASDPTPISPNEVKLYAKRIQKTEQKGRGVCYEAWSALWGAINHHQENEDDRGQ